VRRLDDELALIRNASEIEFIRYVYVVPSDRPDLFGQMSREFESDREVEVVLDRRVGARRKQPSDRSPDRRRGDRRGAADPWRVHLSVPFRRDRGRQPEVGRALDAPAPRVL